MTVGPERPPKVDGPETRRPAAMCLGPGHVVVYGEPGFRAAFGAGVSGFRPVRDSWTSRAAGLAVLDAVLDRGRPLARWIRWRGGDWRLTVAPRLDVETNQAYGVSMHLRDRGDELNQRDR